MKRDDIGGSPFFSHSSKSPSSVQEQLITPNQSLIILVDNKELIKLDPITRMYEEIDGVRVIIRKTNKSILVKNEKNEEILSGSEVVFSPGETILTIETNIGLLNISCKSISSQYSSLKGAIFSIKGNAQSKIVPQE